jgi:hypothetical protein
MFLQAGNLFCVVRAIEEVVIIELRVVRAVELSITNLRGFLLARAVRRSLIINIKVFRATEFILALLSTTMLSVDFMTISIAFVN